MTLPLFLVAVPPIFGVLVLFMKDYRIRRVVVGSAGLVQMGLAIALVASTWRVLPLRLSVSLPGMDYAILCGELLLAAYFAYVSLRKRRILTLMMSLAQAGVAIFGERWTGNAEVRYNVFIDQFSLLMVLIIGVVGGLIVFYATGYMHSYHEHHPEIRDRRRVFSFTVLTFLGAMYGIVMANDLRLVLLFWEMTTWASFILISYNEDAVSEKSAFRALNMNMFGGISFAIGIVILAATGIRPELDGLMASGAAAVAIPVAFIALAGLVKAAQFPFTPWLLGAMVAPTPVSALLHSSTMVKAGVYLLIRLAPALEGTHTGDLVALVGILTFIVTAFIAVSRRNAKRILALSTVSNLGLIVVCAGVGTYQLVWVAFFLILFHAVAKALLFLAVGTTSAATRSLDIEDMGGLITRMPRLTLLLVIGIASMFVAPFGMLVSKWAAMEAFVNMKSIAAPFIVMFLAFGSSTTVLFWTKWIGILIRMPDPGAPRGLLEAKVSKPELVSEVFLAAIAVLVCVSIPFVSRHAVEPFLLATYGRVFGLDEGNARITIIMVVMTLVVPSLLMFVSKRRNVPLSTAYMSGRPSTKGLGFKGSAGTERTVELRSYYLERFFNEDVLLSMGIGLGLLLVIIIFGTVLL